jgi:hypothetical protein
MCVSMGLISEPCCANLDCETQPFILQSGFAHRHHPSGAHRLRHAGSSHTGWTCPPARETAAEIAYKLSPCKPLRLRYARGLTAHRLDCPRQAKNNHNATQARMLPASPLLASHFDCAMQGGSQQPPPARETAACNATQSGPPAMRRNVRRLLQPSS